MFASGWRTSFSLVRYSVTVDSSAFAVSLFLGDFSNLILLCDRCVLRHHAYGFGDPCLCLRVRSSHPRPPVVTAPVCRGCPAGTHGGDDSSRVMSHPERQLCACCVCVVVLVSCVVSRRVTRIRQPGTVELIICVLTAMKCPHLLSSGLTGQLSRSGSFTQHRSRRNS